MKALKKGLKPIALLLTALMLFQSCVVYHKTPTTIQQASQEQIRTKIIKTNGEKSKYKYITYEEGQFLGVIKKSGELDKNPLSEQEITKVLIENKSASKWATVGVLAYAALGVFAIIKGVEVGSALSSL